MRDLIIVLAGQIFLVACGIVHASKPRLKYNPTENLRLARNIIAGVALAFCFTGEPILTLFAVIGFFIAREILKYSETDDRIYRAVAEDDQGVPSDPEYSKDDWLTEMATGGTDLNYSDWLAGKKGNGKEARRNAEG